MTTAVTVHTPARRVDVTGEDRARYLEDVTSQHLLDVPAGQVRGTLYLNAHGAPEAMFDVAVLADRFVLLVPDGDVADRIVEVLGGRTFLLDARFDARDDEVVALRGDGAAGVADTAGIAAAAGRVEVHDGVLVVGRVGGVDLVGPTADVAALVGRLHAAGATHGDEHDLERWRVVAGVPAWGSEVAPPHLPEELGLLPTHVHLAKGCYPGQEAVARMWMLGRPRRRLAVVAATGGGALAAGWEAGTGRRAVTVTTVDPDGQTALAFVPGDAAPGDAFNDGDGGGIEVVRLIGDDPSPPGHDPAVTRRRDRPRA